MRGAATPVLDHSAEARPAPDGQTATPPRPDRRPFWIGMSVIASAAALWRVLYVLLVTRHDDHFYDAFYYNLEADVVAHGHFFEIPFATGPDAAHPPLTVLAIVPVTWLFGAPTQSIPQRLTMAVLGVVVVVLVGILGRAVAGYRVGLLAAAIAAAYPNMWMPNGVVMSETLSMLSTAWLLVSVYRLVRLPGWRRAVPVGVACATCILTRAELVLFVPMVVLPAAWACRSLPWRRRVGVALVAVAACAVVLGPWVGRNLATFTDATYVSTGEGGLLLGANCPGTYSGPFMGGWLISCLYSPARTPAGDQSVVSADAMHKAEEYAEHHLSRVPAVVAVRVLRQWGLWAPIQMASIDVNEGRPYDASLAGLAAYYLMVPFAVGGAVVLRRRRTMLWPLVVPAVVVTLVAASAYGTNRFRAPFEVPLVVLASVGMAAAARSVRRWRGGVAVAGAVAGAGGGGGGGGGAAAAPA